MRLEDGGGKNPDVQTDEFGRLNTSSKMNTNAAVIARDFGMCFSWSAAKDIDAGDTILLLCNNSTTRKLYIDTVYTGADVSTRYTLFSPAYPTLAGDVVTGVNSNRSSGIVAEASAYQDETGNTQANIMAEGLIVANSAVNLSIDGRIVLGYHDCIAVDIVAEPTMATCTIVGYYE